MTGPKIARRSLLAGAAAAAAAPATSLFAPLAHAADNDAWTGYTICDSCNHMPMCGIQFEAVGNTVTGISNWKEHPNNSLCSKGISTLQRLYNPNRLLYPIKRTAPKDSKDPGWIRISWDEAIKTIAERLSAVKAKHGADRVMFYCGDPKEPRPPVMRLARYFGSPNYCCESSVACNLAMVHALELSYGGEISGGMGPKTKCLMIVGQNGAWSKPHGFFRGLLAAKARGMKLIVMDVRRTKVAEQADIHLQPRGGTDGAVAWGMMRVLIKEGLVNKPFIDKWCIGYDELVAYAEKFTPEYVEKESGVPAELVVKAARMFADGPSGITISGQSIMHQHNGCNNARACSLLMALTGNVENAGGGMLPNWPSPEQYQEAIRKVDFSFAADNFYRDETHHDMDIVLPAALNFERYAPFGVHGRKVSVRRPVKPQGEAWEDWKIACTIGAAVCDPETFFHGDPVKACDSILKDWGVTYEKQQGVLPNLQTVEFFPPQTTGKHEKALLRFDGKPGFRTPSGKIELVASLQAKHGFPGLPVYVEPPKPTAEYPFKLLNGTRRPYITHSKTRSDQPYLLELEPESTINMHPKDAEKLGIKEGDGVWLVSPYCDHKVRAKVRVTILCQPGLIDAQYGWRGDQETQPLIPRKNWDPISGYPCCNDVCIRVEKA